MTDTPTLYSELKPDVEAIALALFDMSQHLLRENGNFLPHAAVLLESGEIRFVGATTDSEDGTSISTEILPLLHSGLRELAEAEPVKAIGVAENVTVTMSGEPATAATKCSSSMYAGSRLPSMNRSTGCQIKGMSTAASLRKKLSRRFKRGIAVTPNPSIERTSQRPLRALCAAAHVER